MRTRFQTAYRKQEFQQESADNLSYLGMPRRVEFIAFRTKEFLHEIYPKTGPQNTDG